VNHNDLVAGIEQHPTFERIGVIFLESIKAYLNVYTYSSSVLVISEGVPVGFFNF
jgi:hypothetical protein